MPEPESRIIQPKFCGKCGAALAPKSNFCPYCGMAVVPLGESRALSSDTRNVAQGSKATAQKPCPFCHEPIPAHSTRCPHCQNEWTDSSGKSNQPEIEKEKRLIWGSAVLVLMLVLFIYTLFPLIRSSLDQSAQGGTGASKVSSDLVPLRGTQSASTSTPFTGEEGRLTAGGSEQVPVALTEEAFDTLINAAVAKDSIGLFNQVGSGDVFLVEPGTRILVLEHRLLKMRVRVLEGPHLGEAGWVPQGYVHRQ